MICHRKLKGSKKLEREREKQFSKRTKKGAGRDKLLSNIMVIVFVSCLAQKRKRYEVWNRSKCQDLIARR